MDVSVLPPDNPVDPEADRADPVDPEAADLAGAALEAVLPADPAVAEVDRAEASEVLEVEAAAGSTLIARVGMSLTLSAIRLSMQRRTRLRESRQQSLHILQIDFRRRSADH
jgi:hypothetical protein